MGSFELAANTSTESPEAVQPGEAPLYHPPVDAKSGAVPGVPAGDGRNDASGPNLVAIGIVVVAAADEERIGSAAGVSDAASNGWKASFGSLTEQGTAALTARHQELGG